MKGWRLTVGSPNSRALGRWNSPLVLSVQHITQRRTRILEGRSVTNIARLTIAAMVLLTGCATIRGLQARDTEELLTAAGFKRQLVDDAYTTPLTSKRPGWSIRRRARQARDGSARPRTRRTGRGGRR